MYEPTGKLVGLMYAILGLLLQISFKLNQIGVMTGAAGGGTYFLTADFLLKYVGGNILFFYGLYKAFYIEPEEGKKEPKPEKTHEHAKKSERTVFMTRSNDSVEIDLGKIGASISSLFGGKKSREETRKEKKEEREKEEYHQTKVN